MSGLSRVRECAARANVQRGPRRRLGVWRIARCGAHFPESSRAECRPPDPDPAGATERTMVLQRVIQAPRSIVWGAWMNPETLPQWWGPEGFSCRTKRIDLRTGGEWVFD